MACLWNPPISTGINQIEEQHRQHLDKIGELLSVAGSPNNLEKVKELINFLDNYFKSYFSTEEAIIKAKSCPEINFLLGQHKYFNEEFTKIKELIRNKGITLETKLRLNNLLSEWFIKHISNMDKKLSYIF